MVGNKFVKKIINDDFNNFRFQGSVVAPAESMEVGKEARSGFAVVEKFEKYFGYLARCEGKFRTTTLQNTKFGSKWDENTEFHSAKIWNFDF